MDDVAQLEKIRIFDARVERPPHYDTFAGFTMRTHYGDVYVPYVKQEEPLKIECQHFVDCIRQGTTPLTGGQQGLETGCNSGGVPPNLEEKAARRSNSCNGKTASFRSKVNFNGSSPRPANGNGNGHNGHNGHKGRNEGSPRPDEKPAQPAPVIEVVAR